MFIDGFVHPIFGLLIATMHKISALLYFFYIRIDGIPDFFDTKSVEARIA